MFSVFGLLHGLVEIGGPARLGECWQGGEAEESGDEGGETQWFHARGVHLAEEAGGRMMRRLQGITFSSHSMREGKWA